MLEHSNMQRMREKHPDWVWNRSDRHVILGVPQSHEGYKTPVEPGNSFSPGAGSYGVSTWVHTGGTLHTPEEKPLEALKWSFVDGHLPVLVSEWQAGNVQVKSRLFTDGDAQYTDIKDYFAVELSNPTAAPVELTFYVAIRSFGASGSAIRKLEWKDGKVFIGGKPVFYALQAPTAFGALSYADSQSDISVALKSKTLPAATSVDDDSTWASGALAYVLTLQPGETRQFDFIAHIHANWSKLRWLKPPQAGLTVDQAQQAFLDKWAKLSTIKLEIPDARFTDAFYAQLAHLFMFTVYDQPRISPISYPLWWLRDGVYAVNALNKGGYHEFAERVIRSVAHRDAFGGFGAEGDGPSESIWMLTEHYLLSGSLDYLREMYPHIERKADLLIQMRHTDVPILGHTEIRTPQMMLNPESDVMCVAADDGLITGRMDGHFPILWINAFAYLALRRAALSAELVGADGSRFAAEADDLQATLVRRAPELFGKNDRDTNSAFWPTGWASRDNKDVLAGFDHYWDTVRCPNGVYTREPEWTYFEAGQAHNNLILGRTERALLTIEHFLNEQVAPGLYTYHEGIGDENSSLQWQRTRGWDQIAFVTPHGWTAAEFFLLLRDCIAREENDTLILGSGVPQSWLDKPFGVQNLPTYFGKLSYSYDPAAKKLTVEVERQPANGVQATFPAEIDLKVTQPA